MYNFKLILLIIIIFNIFHYLYFLNEQHYYNYYLSRQNKTNPKVYDIGHKYLPDIEKYQFILNFEILFIIYWLFYNSYFFIDFLILMLIIYFIRLFVIQLTVLPKMKNCTISNSISITGYCYDKIFSGHFSFFFLFTLFLFHYKHISQLYLFIVNLLYAFLIIATRAHYTVDVFVSLLISFVIFQNRQYILKFFKK